MGLFSGIAAFSQGLDAINALADFAFGATGGVVLGDFAFFSMEVPERITWGSAQAMNVHRLPGGERVFDLMGPDPRPIRWSGLFIDGDPLSRAAAVAAMCDAGMPVPLVFGEQCYTVIIASFEAETQYSRAPYRISCVVVPQPPADQSPDLTSSVLGDIQGAIGTATSALQPVLSTAQTALQAVGVMVPGSAALAQAGGFVAQAQGSLLALQGTAETAINGIASLAPEGGLVANPASLLSAVTQTGALASLTQTAGYLGRVAANVL